MLLMFLKAASRAPGESERRTSSPSVRGQRIHHLRGQACSRVQLVFLSSALALHNSRATPSLHMYWDSRI